MPMEINGKQYLLSYEAQAFLEARAGRKLARNTASDLALDGRVEKVQLNPRLNAYLLSDLETVVIRDTVGRHPMAMVKERNRARNKAKK